MNKYVYFELLSILTIYTFIIIKIKLKIDMLVCNKYILILYE